jgi:hypothetical protein
MWEGVSEVLDLRVEVATGPSITTRLSSVSTERNLGKVSARSTFLAAHFIVSIV